VRLKSGFSMIKLTPKQEKFARLYIELSNASEAYRRSYDAKNMKSESIHVNACKLLADAKVAQRVKELQEMHVKRHMVTVDSLTKELEEARELALRIENPAPAVSATLGKAKLHGLLTDKIEAEVTAKFKPMFGRNDKGN